MPIVPSPAATRYAKALFQLAKEGKSLAEVGAAAAQLATSVAEAEVATALQNPRLSPAQRKQFVAAMVKAVKAPQALASTMGLLAQSNRLALLPQVLEKVQNFANAEATISSVHVQTAQPLTDAQKTQIKIMLKQHLKSSDVQLHEEVKPALMSGFRAFFNGQVWDVSLSGKLAKMKAHLSAVKF